MSNGKLDEGGRLLMAMGATFCEEAKKSKHSLTELIEMADNVSKTGATIKRLLESMNPFSWVPKNKCQVFVFTDEKGQSSIGSVGFIPEPGSQGRILRLWVTIRDHRSYGKVLGRFCVADGEGKIYSLRTLKDTIGDAPLPPVKENKQLRLPKEGTIVVLTPVSVWCSLPRMRVYVGKVTEKAMKTWLLDYTINSNDDEWVPQVHIYTTKESDEALYWHPIMKLWSLSCVGDRQYYSIDP